MKRTLSALLLAGTVFSHPATAAVVIDLNDPANASRTTWSVPRGTDVTVIGSKAARSRQISIQGARNVHVEGGVWKPTIREYDGTIHTKDITGAITIDGAMIDNSSVRGADGVIVNANGKTKVPFTMTNSTITGIRGQQNGDHADGVQPQGEVGTFTMRNVRIATDYQGLMLADQPGIAYGGKVDKIDLTNVAITKLAGGEGGCRYPIITGGDQQVSLRGVSVYSQPGCRGNGVLNVDNRAQISGEVSYNGRNDVTGADGGLTRTTLTTGDQDPEWVEDAIRNMRRRGLTTDQIQARFAREGINLGSHVIDGVIEGAIGADLGIGREIMNALTGKDTGGLQRDLVNEGFLLAEDLIESYIPGAIDYISGGTCSPLVMDIVAGAASGIAGVFTGGRATVIAQLAQQIQLMWANKCASETNEILRNQRQLQEAMVRGLDKNAVARASEVEEFARSVLGSSDNSLYAPKQEDIIWETYQSGMPDGWQYGDAADHTGEIRRRTNLASQEAAATQAAAQRSIGTALLMADEAQDLSMGADGQTQAIQAQTQMIRSQIAIDASRQAADASFATAQLRIAEEQRAQEVTATQKIERFYGPGELDRDAQPRRALFQ